MISGLSEEVLNWASSESGERYLFELSSAFCEEIEQQEMPDIPPEIDEELILLQKQSVPQSSQRHIKLFVEIYFIFKRKEIVNKLREDSEMHIKQLLEIFLLVLSKVRWIILCPGYIDMCESSPFSLFLI